LRKAGTPRFARGGRQSIVKRCLEFPIERPADSKLERWQTAIDARPAKLANVGNMRRRRAEWRQSSCDDRPP